MLSLSDVQVRFVNGSYIHIEKADTGRTWCGMTLFDDVALCFANMVDDPPTCIWCVARREK